MPIPPIDPALMAQLQAQGYIADPANAPKRFPQGPPVGAPPPGPPPAPLSPIEQMLSGGLQAAGVPKTVAPPPGGPGAPGTPGAAPQGVFDQQSPERAQAPGSGWTPPGPSRPGPSHAVSTVSPEIRNLYEKSFDERRLAQADESKALVAQNEQAAAGIDREVEARNSMRLHQEMQRRVRQDALDKYEADARRLQAEASNMKVDPNRAGWDDGELIGAAIAGIFGAWSGHNKGGGGMMSMVNDRIARDIDAQKANIANKQKGADAASNLFSKKLQQFGDADAADLATRNQMLEEVKLKAQADAMRSGSPLKMAQAKEAAAQIDFEQAKNQQGLERWTQGGSANGITPEDQKRAFELHTKYGMPINQAIQAAMALRGAAPSEGLPQPHKQGAGGKADKEDLAAARLEESSKRPLESLGVGDRITAGLSHLPVAGPLFQGTEGARKEQAIEASNVPVYGYAHTGLGMRRTEDMEHAAGALMPKPGDSQARINQKLALRALVARDMKQAIIEAKKAGIDLGVSEKRAEEDEGGEE